MDECPGKQTIDGLVISRKGSSLTTRDGPKCKEQNGQLCYQLGSSSRLNSMKSSVCSEKLKSSRTSSNCGKERIGSSSRTSPKLSRPRKSAWETRKPFSSHLEIDTSENSSSSDASSSGVDEPGVAEPIHPPNIGRGLEHGDTKDGECTSKEVNSSSEVLSARSRRNFIRRSMLSRQDMLRASPETRPNANVKRYGLRNLKCNSISDVISSGCSLSDISINRGKEVLKKRTIEGESSSSREEAMRLFDTCRHSSAGHGIFISDSRQPQNQHPSWSNGIASVRTRRSSNRSPSPRPRYPNQDNVNNLSLNEPHLEISQTTQAEVPISTNASSSPHSESSENHSSFPNSYGRPGSGESLRSRISARSPEIGITRSFRNREGFRPYNIDGIAQVLLTLESIEQDEELSYEDLLVVETNLLLHGLSFHDQHRHMRLDIDNMSYEELLALEERMGTVSTALTEEALKKCLKKSIYKPTPLEDWITDVDREEDLKCSICQEEYVIGDEVGRLQCKHRYHVNCIHHWLRQKNWCPVCRAYATPSS